MLSSDIYTSPIEAFVNIPADLKSLPTWVCWKLEERIDKDGTKVKTKVPYHPSGKRAKANDQSTWSTYSACLATVEAGSFDGVGFEFTPPYVGVDLDKCRDPETGIIEPGAADIIQALDSYTELSPSGKGVHIILKGVLPPEGRRRGGVEMYSTGRFFTMTGKHLHGTQEIVRTGTEDLWTTHERIFPDAHKPANVAPALPNDLDVQDVISKALKAKNGEQFKRLWEGDKSDHEGDHSKADLALCQKLAFWTGRDAAKIDAIFRQSGLMRSKWDQRHGTRTYGDMTITKAIERTTETYNRTGTNEPPPSTICPTPTKAADVLSIIASQPPESFDKQEITYLIEPEIPRGALVMISGKPGSGKSTLVLKWCLQMAKDGNEVLYLDRDNPLFIAQDRIERFGGKTHPNLRFWGLWNKDAKGEPLEPPFPNSDLLRQCVKAMRRPVVVIDTLAAFSECDENDNSAMGMTFKALRALTHLGATVLVIHHTAKNGSWYRGASSMEGAVDAGVLVVSTVENGLITKIEVQTQKTRIGDGKPIVYEMVDGIPERKTATFQDLLYALLDRNQGLTKEKFEDLARKANFRRATVRDFLETFIVAGKIKYDNRKLYVKQPEAKSEPECLADLFESGDAA
jgi:putative DNA primase/helicase